MGKVYLKLECDVSQNQIFNSITRELVKGQESSGIVSLPYFKKFADTPCADAKYMEGIQTIWANDEKSIFLQKISDFRASSCISPSDLLLFKPLRSLLIYDHLLLEPQFSDLRSQLTLYLTSQNHLWQIDSFANFFSYFLLSEPEDVSISNRDLEGGFKIELGNIIKFLHSTYRLENLQTYITQVNTDLVEKDALALNLVTNELNTNLENHSKILNVAFNTLQAKTRVFALSSLVLSLCAKGAPLLLNSSALAGSLPIAGVELLQSAEQISEFSPLLRTFFINFLKVLLKKVKED